MEEMPALNSSARGVSGSVNSAHYGLFSQICAALLSDHQPKQISLQLPSDSALYLCSRRLG